jgi:photosystem II stability/assembly factor-like uncharacterized protein
MVHKDLPPFVSRKRNLTMNTLTTVTGDHVRSIGVDRETHSSVYQSRAYTIFAVLAGCFFVAMFLLLVSSGLGDAVARIASSRLVALKGPRPAKEVRSDFVWKPASINAQPTSNWQWVATRVPAKQGLVRIQLLDSSHVWIASNDGQLYKTEDTGDTWKQITPKLPAQSYLTAMSFVTPDAGRIAISKTITSTGAGADADSTWILETSDGGKNWKTELAIDGAQVGNILFADQDYGWATGRRFGNVPPEQDSDLILHTVDGGRTWSDVSWSLPIPGKGVEELYAVRRDGASLLTLNGMIFNSDDTGRTWRQVGAFRDDYDQTAVQRIGSTRSDGMWLLGGAASVEGTWSLLAQKPVAGDWTGYRLDGLYLSDAVYLSETSILACGFQDSSDRVSSPADREGVILYSGDGGQSWITAYRNSGTLSINSIAADSNNVWAVGEGGLVLRVNTSQIAATTSSKSPQLHFADR